MSTRHTTAEQRMLYVMDALELDQREQVEAHVLTCPQCHTDLMAEARVEATLREVCAGPLVATPVADLVAAPRPLIDQSPQPERSLQRPSVRRAIFALAAAAVLFMMLRPEPTPQRWPVTPEQRLTDYTAVEQALTPQEEEGLACDRPSLTRICAWDGAAADDRFAPAVLHNVTCDQEAIQDDQEITCALPAVAAEPIGTCGP